ncbi:MAG: hypothetical protein O7H41_00010 [Planctomycetota bacterium]|nr:hypothetical protein [Planctomycetota bacterium]
MNVTKHEFLWAIVKGLGIYFLIGGLLGVVQILMQKAWPHPELGGGSYFQSPALWMGLVGNLLRTGIGAYMLLDGSWLIELASGKRTRPEADVASPGGESSNTAE